MFVRIAELAYTGFAPSDPCRASSHNYFCSLQFSWQNAQPSQERHPRAFAAGGRTLQEVPALFHLAAKRFSTERNKDWAVGAALPLFRRNHPHLTVELRRPFLRCVYDRAIGLRNP